MNQDKEISQGELEVMGVLWRRERASLREIHADLNTQRRQAMTTVATLLSRLRGKGYVGITEEQTTRQYIPLVSKGSVVKKRLDDMVSKVFSGDISPIAAYITEGRTLTPEQLDSLEEMIRNKRKEMRDE